MSEGSLVFANMQDYIEALGREVARIVTAPYAPSLQVKQPRWGIAPLVAHC